jgi:hypothetical protein
LLFLKYSSSTRVTRVKLYSGRVKARVMKIWYGSNRIYSQNPTRLDPVGALIDTVCHPSDMVAERENIIYLRDLEFFLRRKHIRHTPICHRVVSRPPKHGRDHPLTWHTFQKCVRARSSYDTIAHHRSERMAIVWNNYRLSLLEQYTIHLIEIKKKEILIIEQF